MPVRKSYHPTNKDRNHSQYAQPHIVRFIVGHGSDFNVRMAIIGGTFPAKSGAIRKSATIDFIHCNINMPRSELITSYGRIRTWIDWVDSAQVVGFAQVGKFETILEFAVVGELLEYADSNCSSIFDGTASNRVFTVDAMDIYRIINKSPLSEYNRRASTLSYLLAYHLGSASMVTSEERATLILSFPTERARRSFENIVIALSPEHSEIREWLGRCLEYKSASGFLPAIVDEDGEEVEVHSLYLSYTGDVGIDACKKAYRYFTS